MGLINKNGKLQGILTEDERMAEVPTDIILTTNGKEYVDYNYQGLEDFMLVRLTDNPPSNNRIKTPKEAIAKDKDKIKINGQEYDYEYEWDRKSIHFTINGEVSSHLMGNWDNTKYAVLIPFKDIKSRIVSAAPQDTFTYGEGIDVPESGILLCPQTEIEKMQKENPDIQIVGYEGNKGVQGFANAMIQKLGYNVEDIGKDSWRNDKSQKQFKDILEKENIYFGSHYGSKYSNEDIKNREANMAIAIYKLVKDNQMIKSGEDVSSVSKEIAEARSYLERSITGNNTHEVRDLKIIYEKLEEAQMPLDDECKKLLNDIATLQSKPGSDMDKELIAICKSNKEYLNKDIDLNGSNNTRNVIRYFVNNENIIKFTPELLADIIQLQTLNGIQRTKDNKEQEVNNTRINEFGEIIRDGAEQKTEINGDIPIFEPPTSDNREIGHEEIKLLTAKVGAKGINKQAEIIREKATKSKDKPTIEAEQELE